MTEVQKLYICGICGVTGETCGDWCRCSLFNGYICSSCCWNCLHRAKFDNCSITWCKAVHSTKK